MNDPAVLEASRCCLFIYLAGDSVAIEVHIRTSPPVNRGWSGHMAGRAAHTSMFPKPTRCCECIGTLFSAVSQQDCRCITSKHDSGVPGGTSVPTHGSTRLPHPYTRSSRCRNTPSHYSQPSHTYRTCASSNARLAHARRDKDRLVHLPLGTVLAHLNVRGYTLLDSAATHYWVLPAFAWVRTTQRAPLRTGTRTTTRCATVKVRRLPERVHGCMLIACLMYSSPSRIPSLHPSTLPAHTACRKSSRSPSRLMIHTRCVSLDTPLSAVHAFSIEVHLGHTECISYHLTSMSMHVLPSLHPARFTPCRFCQSRRQVLATTPLILSECDSLACGRSHPFLIPYKTSEWWVALCETTSQSTQYEFRCVSLITTAPYSDDAECPIPTHAPS